MTVRDLLCQYRWGVRERDALRRQKEALESPWWKRPDPRGAGMALKARGRRRTACEEALEKRERELDEALRSVEKTLERPMPPRTRLILRQYYCLGMTDRQIAEENGFSDRTAGAVRNAWLREHGDREAEA